MSSTVIYISLFISGMVAQCLLSAFLAYHREAKAKKQAFNLKMMETLAAAEKIIEKAKEEGNDA